MKEIIATIQGLTHTYLPGTPHEAVALCGAELTIRRGGIAALIGPNGAGKSTLVYFLNGLLRPTEPGRVILFGQDTAADIDLAALRRRVGLVFQSSAQQLFERFVGDDIAYGPRELGLPREAVRERVKGAMAAVGLDFAAFVDRHTFSLSGGEMRRVALAGVLAMRPELLVLDEATTGLDPRGRRETHALLRRLRDEEEMTVLLVSNDMDEVAELADTVTVLYEGHTVLAGAVRKVFAQPEALRGYGLTVPSANEIVCQLREAGLPIDPDALTVAEAEEAIWRAMTR